MIGIGTSTSTTRSARRAELARIFARGYVRALVARNCSQKELAERPEGEAPCGPPVNGKESPEPKDFA